MGLGGMGWAEARRGGMKGWDNGGGVAHEGGEVQVLFAHLHATLRVTIMHAITHPLREDPVGSLHRHVPLTFLCA